jgi:hypothetical protein
MATSTQTPIKPNNISESIWYDDIQHFITYDNYYVILPVNHMTNDEKLNAIVRFFIYLGIALTLLHANYKYLFLGIVVAIISIFLHKHEKQQKEEIKNILETNNMTIVDNKICTSSSVQNPFMNPSIVDIKYNPNRPNACSLENSETKEKINDNFNKHLFRDVSDLYGKYASQRQFYTVASTTIPNDQKDFALWCYGRGSSCKDGNGMQCLENISANIVSSTSSGS